MSRRALTRSFALLAVVLLAGCAYFNALYNARRLYRDAEVATNRGDLTSAEAAHRESLEKAARSLRQDPAGRWADDALLLVAQNHFALGDCRASAAALERLIRESDDRDLLARARAYMGAANVCLHEPAQALDFFAQALPDIGRDSPTRAFALLWRARARFDTGNADSAWADLAAAARVEDAIGRSALLEQIVRALDHDRPDLAIAATHALLANPAGDLHGDSVRALAGLMSERWGGRTAREALEPAPEAPWAGEVRDRLVVERARQAALAGDTALALRELETAADRSSERAANAARLAIARIMLTSATDPAQLAEVRTVLLPAISEQSVRPLINSIGVVGALLEQAQQGQPLALFAAAELARDRLNANALARRLFVSYADVAGPGPWATKSLLGALALDPPAAEASALHARFAQATDIYAVAARGSTPSGYEESEARLDRLLEGMLARASADAERRNIAIGEAIAEIDSLTASVRADSLALACGFLADSLGLVGIRRDSVSAACRRDDHAVVDSFLRVDSLVWKQDSTDAQRPEVEDAEPDVRPQ